VSQKRKDPLGFVAEQYVNQHDARLYWHFVETLQADGSKHSTDDLETLRREVESRAGLAFLREVTPLIEGNERLEWLMRIVIDSLEKRWKLDTEKVRRAMKNRESAVRKSPKISKDIFREALAEHKKLSSFCRELGIDPKTAKRYADQYGYTLPRAR
jgi:hypothetical protein